MTESRSATGSSGSGMLPILSIADETGLGLGATVGRDGTGCAFQLRLTVGGLQTRPSQPGVQIGEG
eukprot:scaffold23306_cov125-Isochrysis_galbana.AAC.6